MSTHANALKIMRDSIQSQDSSGLGEAAHSMKGSAGSVGAHGVQRAASNLEMLARSGDFDRATAGLADLEKEIERLKESLIKFEAPNCRLSPTSSTETKAHSLAFR